MVDFIFILFRQQFTCFSLLSSGKYRTDKIAASARPSIRLMDFAPPKYSASTKKLWRFFPVVLPHRHRRGCCPSRYYSYQIKQQQSARSANAGYRFHSLPPGRKHLRIKSCAWSSSIGGFFRLPEKHIPTVLAGWPVLFFFWKKSAETNLNLLLKYPDL